MPIKKQLKDIGFGDMFGIFGQQYRKIDTSHAGINGYYLHIKEWKLVKIDLEEHVHVEFLEVLITPAPRNV